MVTTDSFPEIADIETSSDDYASRFAGATGQWLLHVQEAATLRLLRDLPQATILEVGGGHAQLTPALVQAGHAVTVVGSAAVCEHRLKAALRPDQYTFHVGNVLALPYDDNAFDVVISYRFLAHVTDWQQFLRELTRVAKRAVIVDYPTVRSVNAIAPALFKFKKGVEKNTRPFTCYPERDLTQYMATQQFRLTQRYAQFFYPMVLHRLLKQPGLSAGLEHSIRPTGLTRLFGSPVIAKFTPTAAGQ